MEQDPLALGTSKAEQIRSVAVLGLTMPPRNLTFVASKSVSAIGNDQSAKHDGKTALEWLHLMKNGPSALLGPLLENSIPPAESITQLTNLLIPGVLRLDLTTVQCAHQMFCALMLGLLGKGTHSGSWRSRSVIKFHPWLHLRQRQVCICLDSQQHHHLDPCAILCVRERTQLLLPPAATGSNCGRGRQGKFRPQAFEAEKDVEQNSHAMLGTFMATGL